MGWGGRRTTPPSNAVTGDTYEKSTDGTRWRYDGDEWRPLSVYPATIRCRLPMEQFRKGATAPTETTRGNCAGFLFDADNEVLYAQFCVPADWDQESDVDLVLACVLVGDETANDDIDWETVVTSVADHEDIDGAAQQTPGVSHDIGAFNSAGMLHEVRITVDYDDGTCPIAIGDYVSIALSRTSNVGNASYVAGVMVIDICLEYQKDSLGTVI